MSDRAGNGRRGAIRVDLLRIADLIAPGSRVLDVGCGDGELLRHLARDKEVDARGLEISQAGVRACVGQGLSVVQGDADTDLRDYPSQAFDYVILSQTLQAVHNPRQVLGELVRIGFDGPMSIHCEHDVPPDEYKAALKHEVAFFNRIRAAA